MRSKSGPYTESDPTRPEATVLANSSRSIDGRPVWSPPTDVLRTERELVVRLELAGTPADEVRVRVSDAELIVSGRRRDPLGPAVRRVDRMEIAFGHFERIIPLTVPVDADRGCARLREGFLEIVLPLAETRVARAEIFEIHL